MAGLFYVWRASNALMKMGFPIHTLSSDFRLALWSASSRMGLSPKEAACVFMLEQPLSVQNALVRAWIDVWILNGDIRPAMIDAVVKAKHEAAMALDQRDAERSQKI